ncbi:MAG: DUF2207 domain-containing protein [Bacilli bacterium]|nr:DUF2207 domain-containing protein [Bacilli bacterium]
MLKFNSKINKIKTRRLTKLIFLFLIAILIVPNNTFANEDEYYISKYNVDIKVNRNNILDIEETITANFLVEKHGIFRKIPTHNTVVREGSTSQNRARILNLKVSDEYETSMENENIVIKIGKEDVTHTGEVNYTIKYSYDLGRDPLKNKDELYFNIIGTGWDTRIENVSFTIHMPLEFDEEKLGFTHGQDGSSLTDNIFYSINENDIKGYYLSSLNPYEALTVRLELTDNYFTNSGYKVSYKNIIAIILPFITMGLAIRLFYKYGKDEELIEPVTFYPPEDMNSLDLAYKYKGYTTNNDVISLLIYLANKGYIKIEEITKKEFLVKKEEFKLIKLKDYDGNNDQERVFMDGLFKEKDIIEKKDLENSFYKTLSAINVSVNTFKNRKKMYQTGSAKNRFILFTFLIVNAFCMVGIPGFYYLMGGFALIAFIPILIFAIIPVVIPITERTKWVFILVLILTQIISNLFIIGLFGDIITLQTVFIIAYLTGFISNLVLITVAKFITKRTEYGNKILGEIYGFRNFLELAEKEKLELLVSENPKYFYDILPYTYVLGLSDKWINKFESIAIEQPDWYSSNSTFNMLMFNNFMHSTLSDVNSAMASMPSSSSGGGFSGGGSGGGGGGSW